MTPRDARTPGSRANGNRSHAGPGPSPRDKPEAPHPDAGTGGLVMSADYVAGDLTPMRATE